MKSVPHRSIQRPDRRVAVARWTLGAIFVVAGALKIVQPGEFHADLLAYDAGFSDTFLRWIAVSLPWLEVVCGGALLANVWSETSGPIVLVLCLTFVVMLGQAVFRGLDLRCGCFGTGAAGWWDRPGTALGRAVLLLGLSLFVVTRAPFEARCSSH